MRRRWIAAGAVVLIAGLTVGLNADFHAPPRYDGAGYSVLALSLLQGRGYREIDRPDAPRHDHFPPGYPLALAGLWRVVGPSVVAAHLFSMGCTVAAAWLAWRWFRRVEMTAAADAMGLAVAVNWMWGAAGGAIQSEPLYLLLSMIVLNVARVRGWRACLGLGALLGLCVLTRHVGICLVLAVVIDRALATPHPNPLPQGGRGPDGGAPDSSPSPLVAEGRAGGERRYRKSWRDTAIIGLSALVIISPWIYWLATVRRNTQVGLIEVRGLLPRIAAQALFYARRIPDALSGPFIEVATVFARSRAVCVLATAGAVVVSAIVLIGLIRAARNPRRRLAGFVPLVTLPMLMVWPFTEAGRFLIPLVPCLLVGAVEGLVWCLRLFLRSTPHPNPPPQGGRGPDLAPQGKSSLSPLAGEGRVEGERGAITRPGRQVHAGLDAPPPMATPHPNPPPQGGRGPENPPPLRGRAGWGVKRGCLRRVAALFVLLIAIPYPVYALITHRSEVQRRSYADFDTACAWIAREAERPGPVLTGHPGEVFWQTGRQVVLPASDDPETLIRQIRDREVAYLLVDTHRFANAPPNPLARLVEDRPGLARRVFGGPVSVYEVRRDSGP